MPPGHRRPDGDAVVFRDRLDVLEPEVCERSSKPGTRCKKAIGSLRVPILLLRIVFRFPVAKSEAMISPAKTGSPVSIRRKEAIATSLFCLRLTPPSAL
jgi:hypothetical protein